MKIEQAPRPNEQREPITGTRKRDLVHVSQETLEDRDRRKELSDLVNTSHKLDQKFYATIWHGPDDLHDKIERLSVQEALSQGEERRMRQPEEGKVDVASSNLVNRRIYENDPPVTAYVKLRSGEGAWRFDQSTGDLLRISRTIDQKTGHLDTREVQEVSYQKALALHKAANDPNTPPKDKIEAGQEYSVWLAFEQRMKALEATKVDVARLYGIKPEEVPLSEEFYPRNSVEAGTLPVREYTVSRIDQMMNFNTVPMTVLRMEDNGGDMASVQEAVKATNPENPPHHFSHKTYTELLQQGKDHRSAKSIMRIAALDYIVKSTDRWHENLLEDPETGECHAIDNGLSLGLRRMGELPNGKFEIIEMDQLRSLPMDAISNHDDWKLDDEAMDELKRFHEATRRYLASREEDKFVLFQDEGESEILVGVQAEEGKEIKYLSSLLRMLYRNEKIAKLEAIAMFKRIEEIIQKGRPPVKELLATQRLASVTWMLKK